MYKTREKRNNEFVFTPFGQALEQCKLIKKNMKKYKNQKGGTIVTQNNDTFDIISESDDYETNVIISGDNQMKCFSGKIMNDDPNTLEIRSFGYNENCTTDKKMERQGGTRNMMNALIQYTKDHYSNINKIILSDNSMVECDTDKGIRKFHLYNLYFLKYKKPYYMKNFYFKYANEDDEIEHEINIELLDESKISINDEILHKFKIYISRKKINNDKINDFIDIIKNLDISGFLKQKKLDCYLYFSFIDYFCSKIDEYIPQHGITFELNI